MSEDEKHTGRWRYGDVPNGGPSYAFVECSCGWWLVDLYDQVDPDPETQYREHLAHPNPPEENA